MEAAAARVDAALAELAAALSREWAAAVDAHAAAAGLSGPRLEALRGARAPVLVADSASRRVWVRVPAAREVKVRAGKGCQNSGDGGWASGLSTPKPS